MYASKNNKFYANEWIYYTWYALECKNKICLSVSSVLCAKRQIIRLIYKSTKTILKYLKDSNEQSFLKGLNIGWKATHNNCQQLSICIWGPVVLTNSTSEDWNVTIRSLCLLKFAWANAYINIPKLPYWPLCISLSLPSFTLFLLILFSDCFCHGSNNYKP